MLGKEMLLTQFEYNTWANGRIFNKAAKIRDEQLNHPSVIGERSLRQILAHLVRIEKVWRLLAETGNVKPERLPDDDALGNVKLMQDFLTAEQNSMTSYLADLDEADLEIELTITRWDGIKFVMIRWYMLSHLLLHSMQHRSEAAIILSNYGHSPGDIDFLFFVGSE